MALGGLCGGDGGGVGGCREVHLSTEKEKDDGGGGPVRRLTQRPPPTPQKNPLLEASKISCNRVKFLISCKKSAKVLTLNSI